MKEWLCKSMYRGSQPQCVVSHYPRPEREKWRSLASQGLQSQVLQHASLAHWHYVVSGVSYLDFFFSYPTVYVRDTFKSEDYAWHTTTPAKGEDIRSTGAWSRAYATAFIPLMLRVRHSH